MAESSLQTLGRYTVRAEIGRGGFATVYQALDTSLNREVALKVLHPQLLTDRSFVERFRKEARTLANLRHPHIVTVYEVNEVEGRLFIAMELAHGFSLARAIAERQRIKWGDTLSILKPVSEALDYAHGQGVVHRDLKPANILLDAERGPLLTDFGFARLLGDSSASMSLSGGILGTPAYIAPEIWELDTATPAADIYALGCIAYEMLTGEVLFVGKTPMQAMRAHDRGPQFPASWPEDVPRGVEAVLQVALARKPEGRFPKATPFWHALNDLEANAQVTREQAERQAVATQWKAEAEAAMAAHEWSAAKMAVGRWLSITPDDQQAQAARAEIERQIQREAERRQMQEDARRLRRETEEKARREAEERERPEQAELAAPAAGAEKAKREAEERERQRQVAQAAALETSKREAAERERQRQATAREAQRPAREAPRAEKSLPRSAGKSNKMRWVYVAGAVVALVVIGILIANGSIPLIPNPTPIPAATQPPTPPPEAMTPTPSLEVCADAATGAKLSYEEAVQIAQNSECAQQGQLKPEHFCNENTGTWWIDLTIEKPGCSPACVVDVNKGTAEINWRCTGLLPPGTPAPEQPNATPTVEPFQGLTKAAPDCSYSGLMKSITAIDASTVKFTLCTSDAAFPSKIAFASFGIQSARHLQETSGKPLESALGTGPYMVEEWVHGDHLTLVANPNYWGDPPKTKSVIFRWNVDSAARLNSLKSGEADGIDNPSPNDFNAIQADSTLRLYPREALNVFYLGINNTKPPFDDERVRQAIAFGIDRQAIVDKLYPPGSSIADYFTPCAIAGGCEGDPWYTFDPEKARKLLAEAGYLNGFKTRLSYRNVARPYLPTPDKIAAAIQAQLQQNLNIAATVDVQESGPFLDNVSKGNLELYLLGWTADYPDQTDFLDSHFGRSANDQFGRKFDDLTAVLAQAASLADPVKRNQLYAQANNLIKQHVPMIPIAHGASATAWKATVDGAHSSPLGDERFALMSISGQDTLVWIQAAEPVSLYCSDETDGDSFRACEQIFDSLLSYGPGGVSVQPGLAETWTSNTDATEWTFNLRQDARFSDGTPVTANDVVETYAVQWDAANPLHVGRSGEFVYWSAFFGGFLNAPK